MANNSSWLPHRPRPRCSRRVIGQSVRWLALRAIDSDTCRIKRRLAEQVRRNRHGVRSRSIARFTARSNSASRCTSSSVTGPGPPTGTSGSRCAASRNIEGGIAPRTRDKLLGQGALAGLPRAGDDNFRHHPHSLRKGYAHQSASSHNGDSPRRTEKFALIETNLEYRYFAVQ